MRVTCGPDTEVAGAILARPAGDLDVHGATHFWEIVSPRLRQETPSLLIDMAGVEWMGSAGIGTLMRLLTRIQPMGGKLAIFGCTERVHEILKITSLEAILNICASPEQARHKLG